MTRGPENNTDIPFALSVRGSVPAEQAEAFYDSLLILLQRIGRTSTGSEVEIAFNLPALDLSYKRLPVENNVTSPKIREMGTAELQTSVSLFGEQVRMARQQLGSSQTRIAQEAGISQSYLSQIELAKGGANGPLRPLASAVIGLARALGMDEQSMFDLAGYEVPQIQQSVSE